MVLLTGIPFGRFRKGMMCIAILTSLCVSQVDLGVLLLFPFVSSCHLGFFPLLVYLSQEYRPVHFIVTFFLPMGHVLSRFESFKTLQFSN